MRFNAISKVNCVCSRPVARSSWLYILVTARAERRRFAQAQGSTGNRPSAWIVLPILIIHVYTYSVKMSSDPVPGFCIPARPAIQGIATGGGFANAASSFLTMGAICKDRRIARLHGNAHCVNNSQSITRRLTRCFSLKYCSLCMAPRSLGAVLYDQFPPKFRSNTQLTKGVSCPRKSIRSIRSCTVQ